jgi:hypothetical protein
MSKLKRYWFEFAISEDEFLRYPSYAGLRRGCGVTAFSEGDALQILHEHLFKSDPLPEICNMVVDVNVSALDSQHVLPNIGIPVDRGIWFPQIWQRWMSNNEIVSNWCSKLSLLSASPCPAKNGQRP